MRIGLRYGKIGLDVDLSAYRNVSIFRTQGMPVIDDPIGCVRACLNDPIGTRPLREIATGRRDACVVVSDITRPVPNAILLPPVLDEIERAGISRDRILLLVATGIHRPSTREEITEILGEDIARCYRVESHDARDPSAIRRIGLTSRGTPVDINGSYLDSDIKVVTGLVEPHFMAGYSGGRKSVAIGLTSVESIKHLHGTGFLEHPGARNCELEDNPLHAELIEMATMAEADFSINALINAERRLAGVFCGDLFSAHEAACEFAERYCVVRTEQPFDIVVTTAAGYPLDTTYYQAVKGLVGALGILAPDGGIVLASECSKGLGSAEFRAVLGRLREIGACGEFIAHISDMANFSIDQWEVEMLVKALRRGSTYIISSGIPPEDRHLTGATCAESVEEALARASADRGDDVRIAVIPEGPYVIPIIDDCTGRVSGSARQGC